MTGIGVHRWPSVIFYGENENNKIDFKGSIVQGIIIDLDIYKDETNINNLFYFLSERVPRLPYEKK